MNRSLRRLYLACAGGFALLILMLGYWQVIAAGGLNDRPGNPYTAERERLVDRGRIVSADGVVLARSVSRRVDGREVYSRAYPDGTLAPQTIGYATPEQGTTGLEAGYNRFLAGSYGTEPILQRLNLRTKRGADLRTTLNAAVQREANAALAGKRGAVVALDPTTGAVLAMASAPTFNLNEVSRDFTAIRRREGGPLVNRATNGRYAPGSTFKTVTAAAGLESGLFTPLSTFTDTGRFVYRGQPITNAGGARYGRVTLTQALTRSINTVFAEVGAALGPRRLGGQMTAFSFGSRPPVDLPEGEVFVSGRYRGNTLLPNEDPTGDVARLAIGQEQLVVSPLQMGMVAAALANRGRLMEPFLVRRVVDRDGGTVREHRPRELDAATTPEVAAELNVMMRRVVEEGTGTAAALFGLSVAGKTGTAETDDPSRNQAWFIGFAPAEAPRVAVAVVVEDTPGSGGVEAAPIAARVMKAALAP